MHSIRGEQDIMDIPILHHKFDATGVGLHFSDAHMVVSFIILSIIVFIVVFLSFDPLKTKGSDENQREKTVKEKIKGYLLIIFFIAFYCVLLSYPNIPRLFTSDAEGKLLMQPNVLNGEEYGSGVFKDFYSISGYDENNTVIRKYSSEIHQAIKDNEEMKKYSIPECDLKNPSSIICGGDKITDVEADKGNETVLLSPHVKVGANDAKLEVDNPNDKGVKLYFWIDEEEIS